MPWVVGDGVAPSVLGHASKPPGRVLELVWATLSRAGVPKRRGSAGRAGGRAELLVCTEKKGRDADRCA